MIIGIVLIARGALFIVAGWQLHKLAVFGLAISVPVAR